jgi:hypothetical protein
MTVQTHKVTDRRKLHFNTLDEIAADVEALAHGNVKALGTWSPGQILEHLAKTMDGSLDGMNFRFPRLFCVTARLLFKKRILTKPMSPGWTFKGEQAKALGPPETSWEDGLRHFRQSLARLQAEARRVPHPILGVLSREEWDQLHCRHSELHLSFLKPKG